jgi:hypothetical protein
MKLEEFKCRVNAVIEETKEGLKNFDVALREERRRYWLQLLDAFQKTVAEAERKHRRDESDLLCAGIAFGITALGEIMKLVAKNDMAGRPFTRFAEHIAKSEDLVVAVGPEEGIGMLGRFELKKLPEGRWGKVDLEGRLLLTPVEFKSRIEDLKSTIRGSEQPPPLPIEIKKASEPNSRTNRGIKGGEEPRVPLIAICVGTIPPSNLEDAKGMTDENRKCRKL